MIFKMNDKYVMELPNSEFRIEPEGLEQEITKNEFDNLIKIFVINVIISGNKYQLFRI